MPGGFRRARACCDGLARDLLMERQPSMFNPKPATMRNLSITAISSDVATLEGLGSYLKRRVAYRGALAAEEPAEETMRSDCVIFYTDGVPPRAAQRLARRLISSPTVSLVILVTALSPKDCEALIGARSTSNRLIVLPAPAWPWTVFATVESSLPGKSRSVAQLC